MVANRFIYPLALAFFSISALSSPAPAADLYYYDGAVKRKLTIDPPSSEKSTSSDRPVGKSTGDSPVFRTSRFWSLVTILAAAHRVNMRPGHCLTLASVV